MEGFMNQPKTHFLLKTVVESGGLQILALSSLVYLSVLYALYFINFELCQMLFEALTFVMLSMICSVILFEVAVIKGALEEYRHK
jgi:hypothetical protein